MYKTVQFAREDLFNQVWETPLSRLAEEIGVSDVALAKACRRAVIPLPGRGYWAKAIRSRPKKPSLPRLKDSYYAVVSFRIVDVIDAPKLSKLTTPKGDHIPVAATLDSPHPLIAKTLQEARRAKETQGHLQLDRTRALNIRVSLDMLDRTTRLLNALITASEAQGYVWKIQTSGDTVVIADGETMKLLVKERLTKRDLPPPALTKRHAGSRWEPNLTALLAPKYEWLPTGQLSFHIEEYFSGSAQKNWNDTARTQLEDKLHEILAGFAPAAAAIRALKEGREAQKRMWEQQEQERKAKTRKVEEQRRLRHKLVQATERWERAQRIRTFCDTVSTRLESYPTEMQSAAAAWLAWASQQAAKLDPLEGDLAHLFSLEAQVEEWFSESTFHQEQSTDWWSVKK
ncbi:hypothetical protein [Pigmentiphaga daeguensis]|uniref:Uncharacterized protein n=1 Tax=Pigmentiphaga daeguensis TaxID=414049 RepID=A0ABN1D5T0_9BURK